MSSSKADSVVVGTLALDMTCNLQGVGDQLLHTSTPGKTELSIGGVGHNVALAATFAGENKEITTRLITELGSEDSNDIINRVKRNGSDKFDTSGILINEKSKTAKYIAIHDSRGELVVACADMESAGNLDCQWISRQITGSAPKCVFFDGNIGVEQKQAVFDAAKSVNAIVGFEPASVPKAAWLADVPSLGVFPNQSLDVCTPNAYELNALYNAFKDRELFDIDNWFPVIDSLRINQDFRNAMENLALTVPELKELNTSGLAQQAFHLLPYIPNLFVKSGSKGVLSFQLIDGIHAIQQTISSNLTSAYGGKVHSKVCVGQHDRGILVQHFPANKVPESSVVSVTGAGDTFCGVLVAELGRSNMWLKDGGVAKLAVIDRAQQSAALTVQSELAVNPLIRNQ